MSFVSKRYLSIFKYIFVLALGLVLAPSAILADSLDEPTNFEIDAQALDTALIEFSEQADIQLVVRGELVTGLESDGLRGEFTPRTALAALLDDTGLTYTAIGKDSVAVATDERGASDSKNLVSPTPVLMAQNQRQTLQASTTDDPVAESEEADKEPRPLDEIIVTGTHIRGIAPESSPILSFDRDAILATGAATLQEFMRKLPQNFSGGSNENVFDLPNDDNSRRNLAMGSSVNLRGLGSGSTLVLLNGHRIAPSNRIGGFVDISMIPVAAIERVEIMTDGASSIYGGDAVAGVVNYVLRDDFDGVEAGVRYGNVTDGGMEERSASIAGGTAWNSGNALLIYDYYDRGNLSSEDRSFAGDLRLPNDLLPSQERISVLASVSQQLFRNLDFGADVLYSERDFETVSTANTGTQLGKVSHRQGTKENLNVSGHIGWKFAPKWNLDVSGNYSELVTATRTVETFEGVVDADVQVDSSFDLWSVDAVASGPILQLPGGTAMLAIGAQYRPEDLSVGNSSRDVYAIFGEVYIPIVGPDNSRPWVNRLEINVSGRFDDYSDFGTTTNPKYGLLWSPVEGLNLRGSYGTSFKPPPVGQVDTENLGASVFPQALVNSVFGSVPADPSIADVVSMFVIGTGKNLQPETSESLTLGLDFDVQKGEHGVSLSSTYFEIDFEGRLNKPPVPGNVSLFSVNNLAFTNPELFPEGTFIFFPTQEQISDVLDSLDRPVFSPFGLDPLDSAIISFMDVSRNLSRTEVRGVDFNTTYSFDGRLARYSLGLNASYLIDYKLQAAVTTPRIEQIDTRLNPIGLKLSGRAGVVRNGLAVNFFVNYMDSYKTDSTEMAESIDSWTTIDTTVSFDTRADFDASFLRNMRFQFSVRNLFDEDPPLTPPDLLGFGIPSYDPTNATPIGRFVSLDVRKTF